MKLNEFIEALYYLRFMFILFYVFIECIKVGLQVVGYRNEHHTSISDNHNGHDRQCKIKREYILDSACKQISEPTVCRKREPEIRIRDAQEGLKIASNYSKRENKTITYHMISGSFNAFAPDLVAKKVIKWTKNGNTIRQTGIIPGITIFKIRLVFLIFSPTSM